MEQTIHRYQVMKEIETGEPFDLVFITADRRRGTGGSIKRVKHFVKITGKDEGQVSNQRSNWFQNTSRNPQHFEHRTLNIYNPSNPAEHAYKVHWRLMVFFNGKRIIQ